MVPSFSLLQLLASTVPWIDPRQEKGEAKFLRGGTEKRKMKNVLSIYNYIFGMGIIYGSGM